MRRALCAAALLAVASTAHAQHPGVDPHAGIEGAPHGERQIAMSEKSPSVPIGTIRVEVVDATGAPVAHAEVNVGTMAAEGRRERLPGRTDASGVATFAGLATGSAQAYRVNVPSEGATYSSTPFRLEPDMGQSVRITRLPITRDERVLLQLVDTQIELREDRAHVTQRVQLMNLGERTYVFPVRGLRYELPHGAIAFQNEPVMTDQHVTETDGVVEIKGSLPPGGVQLPWAFDVPLHGATLSLTFPQHVRTYQWRVIADAPEGMRLDAEAVAPGEGDGGAPVSQFSDPEAGESDGRSVLFTALERTPQDPPLRSVEVRLSGIPTPGPLRWVAVVLVLLIVALAVSLVAAGGGARPLARPNREGRRKELLAEAAELGRERANGEVGPKFFARRRRELVAEMAMILRTEEEMPAAAVTPPPAERVRKGGAKASRSKERSRRAD